ncbi:MULTISPECIES: ferredoxin [unclassified Streptomyces]|uniref:ferredoxin n=1 Tax=unclassified Streptomyces TaxID=2593676 RepID=UPI00278BE084|nr:MULTISPECIES: ferredoxin [unclassified Streptomyces]
MSAALRLRADRDVCIGAGMCALSAPAVFDQDDDGLVLLVDGEPPASEHAAARLAVGSCPSGAITLRDPAAPGT